MLGVDRLVSEGLVHDAGYLFSVSLLGHIFHFGCRVSPKRKHVLLVPDKELPKYRGTAA